MTPKPGVGVAASVAPQVATVCRQVATVRRQVATVCRWVAMVRRQVAMVRRWVAMVRRQVATVCRWVAMVRRWVAMVRRQVATVRPQDATVRRVVMVGRIAVVRRRGAMLAVMVVPFGNSSQAFEHAMRRPTLATAVAMETVTAVVTIVAMTRRNRVAIQVAKVAPTWAAILRVPATRPHRLLRR